jgi:hypothetical protein
MCAWIDRKTLFAFGQGRQSPPITVANLVMAYPVLAAGVTAELGPFANAKRPRRPLWNKLAADTFWDRLVRMHTIRDWIVRRGGNAMDSIIYLVGLIVVVMFILSVLGLH